MGRSRITIGANVAFWGDSVLNACSQRGSIEIGDDSHVDCFCVLYGQGGIRIGRGCAIASGVIIYSQTNQYRMEPTMPIVDQDIIYGEVRIGDDVWIGAGATILPGVKIGDHAVIGARALVRSDVPDWMVAVGVPATILKDRRAPDGQRA